MRGYEENEYGGYDDYKDEEQEEGYEEVEKYEEEEERKPTAEEIKYLELRERLKERIRKKMKSENISANSKSLDKKRKHPSDNYGSFFGPSKPVIAQRVIHESKSLLENQHLAEKVLSSHQNVLTNKKSSSSAGAVSKNGVCQQLPKATSALHKKIQNLKATRDYSFLLSDDAEIPAPSKEPASRNVSARKSEARSSPVPQNSKQLPSNKHIHGGHEERKMVVRNGHMHSKEGSRNDLMHSKEGYRNGQIHSKEGSRNGQIHSKEGSRNCQMQSKEGSYRPTSASKPNSSSTDLRRHGSNNGIGPGRPSGSKGLLPKAPVASVERKASTSGTKSILPASQRPSLKLQPPVLRRYTEQRKGSPEPYKPKMMPKQQLTSSKPQISKPAKHVSSHASLLDRRPKKKPIGQYSDDEGENALNMIRQMFGTDRWRNRDVPDYDSDDMEVGFEDIMREERRSAQIARREDEEQLQLIEEEERRERERKFKKRKR